ncbi:MAG: Mut7-C RNAse domain-containing protein [Candidatus Bipolaricaulota bacterium]
MPTAIFRFYAELNDCLPAERRQRAFPYCFCGEPSVKDAVEALGVPHVEVDLVLVNGASVDFSYRLRQGDRVAVYPVFESLEITPVQKVRPRPLRRTSFVADEHLGKLARLLRLLGFDTAYARGIDDAEIARRAAREGRIVLTRDRGLLKRGSVDHGYWVRSSDPLQQAREVVRRFDLAGEARPFTLCLTCGGKLQPVDKESVLPRIPPRVRAWRDEFLLCRQCDKLFWRGTHHARLSSTVQRILGDG